MTMHDIELRNETQLPPLTQLQKTIILHGIPMLDMDDVLYYKQQAQLRLAAQERSRVCCKTGIGIAVGFLGMALAVHYQISFLSVMVFAVGLVMACISALVLGGSLTTPLSSVNWAMWRQIRWRGYCGAPHPDSIPMPQALKHRARLIEKECPDSLVYVDYLGVDPFIYVTSPDGVIYIGVWNEEGFR